MRNPSRSTRWCWPACSSRVYTRSVCLSKPPTTSRGSWKEAWKRQYIRHLLEREELKNVPRLANSDAADFERLMNLKAIWGVTDEEQRTIEYHELGVQEPVGFVRQTIPPFPTPGMVIKEIPEATKRRMLERLYLEYQDLCAYAHG
jgi:hypothetical protein